MLRLVLKCIHINWLFACRLLSCMIYWWTWRCILKNQEILNTVMKFRNNVSKALQRNVYLSNIACLLLVRMLERFFSFNELGSLIRKQYQNVLNLHVCYYSSQEVIVLDNKKTASVIINGTYVHTTFYPKCNIYHRFFFFLCPLTYVKPLKTTTCLNDLKQWIFKPPSVSTSMNGHNIISRIQRCSIQN